MKVRRMGEKGKHEMKKPSRCAKRGVRREKWERFPEKSSEVGSKTRKDEKKWASQGKKRERALEKSPEIESKTGKSGKNGDFGVKKVGGERRKNGLYCRFCNAMKWQNGRK